MKSERSSTCTVFVDMCFVLFCFVLVEVFVNVARRCLYKSCFSPLFCMSMNLHDNDDFDLE